MSFKTINQTQLKSYFIAWFGSFLGICTIGITHARFLSASDIPLYIGSLGATAVLLYAAPHSPLASMKNTLGGHILSAFIGVSSYMFLGEHHWLAAGLAVSTAIFIMLLTDTLHPPGGATALIAVIGSESIHDLGYFYILFPVTSGLLLLFVVAYLLDKTIKSHFVRLK